MATGEPLLDGGRPTSDADATAGGTAHGSDHDMETGERLAAYLAGELDADGRAAVEAELARDARLRAKLERIRATDAALADLPPVEPPAGFAERLRAAVRTELDDQLPAEGDELAGRRARRRGVVRSWWPQVAVAAAVLAIAGIGITQLTTGGADQEAATDESAGAMSATTQEADAGPTVVAVGRSFDAESLRDLADDARFDEVVGQGLEGESASVAAEEFGTALQDDTGDGDAARATGGGDAAGTAEAPAAAADAPEVVADAGAFGLRTVGDVTEEDLEAVRACLPGLVEAESAVIPVYAEIVTFDGQDAIVYGLVGNDPDQESYRRVELWVLARGDCHVLHYAQVDR